MAMIDRPLLRAASAVATLLVLAGTAVAPERVARAAPLAGADAPPSPESDAAFRSGVDQYNRGNYVAAIATWDSLLGTMGETGGYKVLYNLGLAYQQIGDVTKAIERYRAFVRQVEARPYVTPELGTRADDARRRLAQLESSHGAVRVGAPRKGGLVMTRVGTGEPRAAGYTVWLAPGPHTIELFVGTADVKTVSLEVVGGKTLEVDTSPPEPNVQAPARMPSGLAAPRQAEVRRARPSHTNAWVVGGASAAVVSMALPLSLFVLAGDQREEADALGAGHTRYADAKSSYDLTRTMYLVSYALPVGLAVTTLILFLGGRREANVGLAPSRLGLRF